MAGKKGSYKISAYKAAASRKVLSAKKAAISHDDTDSENDDIDKFHQQRSKVMLGEDDSGDNENELDNEDDFEEGVMNIDVDSDEEDEELTDEFQNEENEHGTPCDDQEESETEDELVDDKAWGSKKKSFYSADMDAEKEEEIEALRMQKAKAAALGEEDYLDDSFQSLLKNATNSSKKEKHGVNLNHVNMDFESLNGDSLFIKDASSLNLEVEKFSVEQKRAFVKKHSPFLVELISDFKKKMDEIKNHLKPILEKVQANASPTDKGLSFLQVKYHLLLTYCTNICFYMLLKAKGQKVDNHPVVDQLIKIRVYLEKMKPIENKLKYQINSLISEGASSKSSSSLIEDQYKVDPLSFKPNPKNLIDPKLSNENQMDYDSDEATDDVYRPPRVAPTFFEDKSTRSKHNKKEELSKKSASQSRLLQELREELSEKPEEIDDRPMDDGDNLMSSINRRTEFEEDNFMRLTQSKKEAKREASKMEKRMNDLDDLNDFGLLDGEEKELEDPRLKKVRKGLPTDKRKRGDHKQEEEDEEIVSDSDGQADSNLDSDMEEDNYYESVKQAKKVGKKARNDQNAVTPSYHDIYNNHDSDRKRPADYQILKNKGLTPYRKKDLKNPRVRQRNRYEKAKKRAVGVKPILKTLTRPYSGEKTGIKPNVSRSTRF